MQALALAPSPSPATASVVQAIVHAREAGHALRLHGSGTWLDAGRPVAIADSLSMRAPGGVIHYEPGDLTLTVHAGTTLGEIERLTADHGQWLALDPFGSTEGTIGATVATASYGPLATGFGTPRDQVLGCEIVTGAGDVVRAGGRVVKNVAGFDLTRLMTGAWGTLGAITEVSVRLRAKPQVDQTVSIALDDVDAAQHAWRWLRESEFRPMAAELLSPALARMVGVARGTTLLLRVGGNDALVAATLAALQMLGVATTHDASPWRALRGAEPPEASVVRLSTAPSSIGALWQETSRAAENAGGFAHATLARGVVRCVLPSVSPAVAGLLTASLPGVTRIAERLPAPEWALIAPVAVGALTDRVRDVFDPDRVLNRGILGESA